jgi:hypothetical protein
VEEIMKIKFAVPDKSGRTLRMTDWNWHHIIRRHPEITSHQEKIIETLEKPDKITDSPDDEHIKYYYKYYKHLSTPYNFMRVIVKYLNGDGFIISAHFVKNIR